MIQQKLRLSTDLKTLLRTCEEMWIAVALISDSGFKFIQDNINKEATQHFLVGIGLPTSPKVLTTLMQDEGNGFFNSRVYHKPNELFHPKVYIVKSKGSLTAFVGSGNCTEGGLSNNLELSVKVDDQDFCNQLLKWYSTLFKFGTPITYSFIQSYSLLFARRIERIAQDKKDLTAIIASSDSKVNLGTIDFTKQFFKKEHFAAFEGTKPWSVKDEVNEERVNVRSKLFKLHSKLYPAMQKKRWDLSEHYVFDDTVSSAIHGQYTSTELGGIWLHYGRDKSGIKAFGEGATPLDFMRLQVIIHKDNVGIWNRIGKDFGSRVDRDHFKDKMTTDKNYRQKFYSIASGLPDDYFIRLNQEKRFVREFSSEQLLTEYVLKDDLKYYFVIGIEFLPDDIRLSETNIVDTIMEHFGKLYPTYDLIKYRLDV